MNSDNITNFNVYLPPEDETEMDLTVESSENATDSFLKPPTSAGVRRVPDLPRMNSVESSLHEPRAVSYLLRRKRYRGECLAVFTSGGDSQGAIQGGGPYLARKDTIVPQMGKEGALVLPKSRVGTSIAVLTSGGDSQGMNAALRAVVRMGLYLGCRVFTIREGYQGMVDGGKNIVEAGWNSVSNIIQRGGTVIGSARCKEFQQREGRLKAAANLLQHNITNLVCIGGDGTLTGANIFRQEWPGLVQELVDTGHVPPEKLNECPNINIVGLVGSIDNDFCGTDMTIGADSALHRIVEAVDAVVATAQSHQRSFVIEVMGRHCGYLALVAGLATEADWIFIPEWPSPGSWADLMCEKMHLAREKGQRTNIIIVAEGAIGRDGNPITAEVVRKTIVDRLKFDTRVTVLGHVQRGGTPSAYDRLLGCRMGAEAVLALLEMTSEGEPCVISIDGNQMVRVPLMKCVARTKQVQKAMDEKQFELACKLRGRSFVRNLEMYKLMTKMVPPVEKDTLSQGNVFNLAVMNVGAPACGMNASVRAFVRVGLFHRCKVFAIQDSFDGLINDKVKEMHWMDVTNWVMYGGSLLGTQKQMPEKNMQQIASALKKFNIHGLLMVGGFEAFHSAMIMADNRNKHPEFCIPIVVIPCTISNNVPGTSFSLGCDTALNEICGQIEKIKQSATGSKRRVFIIETMGGYCGYLATLSALSSGADNAYIYEEKFTVDDIKDDVKVIAQKMVKGVQRYIIVRAESANRNYTTQFIEQLFSEEGKNAFSTRVNVLGHAQQGGSPSPFDRNSATKLTARAVEFLVQQAIKYRRPDGSVYTDQQESAALLGIIQRLVTFSPIQQLRDESDFEHRLPKDQWWLKLRPLLRILAKHDSIYEVAAVPVEYDLASSSSN